MRLAVIAMRLNRSSAEPSAPSAGAFCAASMRRCTSARAISAHGVPSGTGPQLIGPGLSPSSS
eukprot:CAMPEP_0172917324 /NCGR_PEP_ID=MMETSP1075-20121228/198081_1 /TAXON_ID=2916 /ORGANISM="Ceratium fusus, Strain PA161109" /LENGTH=62 /DNA_ID=CAMNT_0013776769 /DNA_START=48 /DNA_END=236 /DNA_ORIENTATION=-